MRVINANVGRLALYEITKIVKTTNIIQYPRLHVRWNSKNGGWVSQFPSDSSLFDCGFTWEAGALMASYQLRLPDEIYGFRDFLQRLKKHMRV